MSEFSKLNKVARNEIRKLRATLLNNIAIGLFVAGTFVPLLAALPGDIEKYGFFGHLPATVEEFWRQVPVAYPLFLAYSTAFLLHYLAVRILKKIED